MQDLGPFDHPLNEGGDSTPCIAPDVESRNAAGRSGTLKAIGSTELALESMLALGTEAASLAG